MRGQFLRSYPDVKGKDGSPCGCRSIRWPKRWYSLQPHRELCWQGVVWRQINVDKDQPVVKFSSRVLLLSIDFHFVYLSAATWGIPSHWCPRTSWIGAASTNCMRHGGLDIALIPTSHAPCKRWDGNLGTNPRRSLVNFEWLHNSNGKMTNTEVGSKV